MNFIARFKSEWSGKETEQELLNCPDEAGAVMLARKTEKESYPPWKLVEIKKAEKQ